jgi:hypothetical protein
VWRRWQRAWFGTMRPQVRDLPPRPAQRALGRGRSSMAEPRVVTPLVPVRLRPVTPKRMPLDASRTRAAEYRAFNPASQGSSPWRRTSRHPSWRNRQTRRSQKPVPARACPFDSDRGDHQDSPVAQRQSGALMRRRTVDRAHPGLPVSQQHRRCGMNPFNEDDVCFPGHEQAAQGLPV